MPGIAMDLPAGWPSSLCLHVGAHKTATTHFQHGLRGAKDDLLAAGVRVLTPQDLRAGAPLGEQLGVSFPNGGRRPDWSEARLADLAGGAERLALSEENILGQLAGTSGFLDTTLYPQGAERVAAIAEAVAPLPMTLALSIRDPANYVVSAYGQALLGGYGGKFADFALRLPIQAIDWVDLAERLVAVPQVTELVVWRQEDYPAVAVEAANILAGAPLASDDWFAHGPSHPGLSAKAVERALAAPEGAGRSRAAEAGRRAFPIKPGQPKFDPFDAEDKALSAEYYADQWLRMADLAQLRPLEPQAGA